MHGCPHHLISSCSATHQVTKASEMSRAQHIVFLASVGTWCLDLNLVTEETERQPHQRIHSPPIDEASVDQTYAGAAIQLQNHHLRIARQQEMVMWWADPVRFLQSSGNAGVRLEDALTQLPNVGSQIVVALTLSKWDCSGSNLKLQLCGRRTKGGLPSMH